MSWTRHVAWMAMAALLLTASTGQAQQDAPEAPQEEASRITLPGSDEVLQLEVDAPSEVRLGQSYEYEARVTNLTDNLVLHNVTIQQEVPQGFHIESAKLLDPEETQDSEQQEQQNQQEPQGDKPNAQEAKQEVGKDDARPADTDNRWTIPTLKPGETRVIRITAISDEEGPIKSCLAITSFTPALCVTTRFVQPDLEIVKVAPEAASLCEEIEFEYHIKNKGTGSTGALTVRDPLQDGLQTATGETSLEFPVDGLEADETRKFVARLHAMKAGTYQSRAVVTEEDGNETRSRPVATEVRSADLLVAIDGPSTEYYGRPMTYTIRVTNAGNAPAPETTLTLHLPESIQVARADEPRNSDQDVKTTDVQDNAAPTLADPAERADEADEADDEQAEQADQAGENQKQPAHDWDLGTLEPGQTREVRVTLRTRDAGEFEQQAVARYICARGEDEQEVDSIAMRTTEVISLPALMMAVVDLEDPTPIDGEVTYRIIVENQGTAADENVVIRAELPEQLELLEVAGATEGKIDQGKIQFEPVETLDAGERVVWTVRAKVREKGEVLFRVSLRSDNQDQWATSEEPTRLVQDQQN